MRILLPVAGWLVLTGADPGSLAFGAIVVAAGLWLGRSLGTGDAGVSARDVVALLPRFLWRALLGGVDVAWRALHPEMPLRPGWVEVPTRLPPGALRAAIGGEFSLMPGTLVAGSRGDRFLVHLLDTGTSIADDVAAEERRLMNAGRRGTAPAGDTDTTEKA